MAQPENPQDVPPIARHIIFMDRDELLDQSARILLDLRIDESHMITNDDIPFSFGVPLEILPYQQMGVNQGLLVLESEAELCYIQFMKRSLQLRSLRLLGRSRLSY